MLDGMVRFDSFIEYPRKSNRYHQSKSLKLN